MIIQLIGKPHWMYNEIINKDNNINDNNYKNKNNIIINKI